MNSFIILVTLLTTYVQYCILVLYFKFFDQAKNYLSAIIKKKKNLDIENFL